MQRILALLAGVLGLGGCVVHADAEPCVAEESYECYVTYSPGYGYSRVCELVIEPAICIDFDDDDDHYVAPPPHRRASAGAGYGLSAAAADGVEASPAEAPSGEGSPEPGAPPVSSDGFEFPCERDSQCGTGLCVEGECFYACGTDGDCGTGDRCALDLELPICLANEEPSFECTRNIECGFEQVCLNSACHDTCLATSDCSNQLDRCLGGVCVPDRRVVSECLLDTECPEGHVCVDATCRVL